MKEFVRGNAVEDGKISCDGTGRERNGRAEGMLHTATSRSIGEVIDKGVGMEGAVVHPRGFDAHDAFNRGSDLVENAVRVGGSSGIIRVENDAVFAAVGSDVTFLELTHFDGRIDQAVVVVRRVSRSLLGQWGSDSPWRRDIVEFEKLRAAAPILGIEKDFGQIKEGMVRIELSPEGTRRVGEDFVFHARAARRVFKLPAAGIDGMQRQRVTIRIYSSDPVHELRKVADLVERVPDGEL